MQTFSGLLLWPTRSLLTKSTRGLGGGKVLPPIGVFRLYCHFSGFHRDITSFFVFATLSLTKALPFEEQCNLRRCARTRRARWGPEATIAETEKNGERRETR